jgi:hypothetical protein
MRRHLFLVCVVLCVTFGQVGAQDEDTLIITAPQPLARLSGEVEVLGTVNPPGLRSYFLEVADFVENPDTAVWTPVSLPQRTPVVDGLIARLSTTAIPDGVYALRLRAVLEGGETLTLLVRPLRIDNASAVPTPEPTPEGPLIVPRPQVVNELPIPVGGQLDNFDENAARLMRAAGMTWIKWQIPFVVGDFSLIDVARDRINWSHERGFYAMLSIKGLRDELGALGADYYPLYAEFVGRVAELGVDAIQVWNEQNIDREWPTGRISPAAYTELLRQAYTAIKAVDETILVITGSPAPTGAEGAFGLDRVWNDDRYYQGMAAAGAANYADCIGIHYNEGIVPPSATSGDPRDNYPTRYFPTMLQRAAAPFRAQGMPLCFSELGYISPDGFGRLPASFAWGQNNTVRQQAEWLRDAIRIAAETPTVQVDLIIVFNVNFTRFVEDDPQAAFAIIRPDGSCPACAAIAELRQPR